MTTLLVEDKLTKVFNEIVKKFLRNLVGMSITQKKRIQQ
jgi:hypothetical protein